MKPDNIATFLGKKLSPQFEGEMGNRFDIGIEGTRIKHGVQWAPLQKSIYSLPALRELLAASNRHYLEFLSVIEDPRAESIRSHSPCKGLRLSAVCPNIAVKWTSLSPDLSKISNLADCWRTR